MHRPLHADTEGRLGEEPVDRVVLYTSGDATALSSRTGIADVRPFSKLEEDLSVANGFEWLSRSIPITIEEIERISKTPSAFDGFLVPR